MKLNILWRIEAAYAISLKSEQRKGLQSLVDALIILLVDKGG
jgi:hypothetical protein